MLLEDTPVSIFLYSERAAGSLQIHIHLRLSNFGFLTLGSTLPGQTLPNLEGIHFFIKRSKTDQMGRCIERTKGRHMCPVPAVRECCRCSTHSSPPTTKIGGHSHLIAPAPPFYPWWSNVATNHSRPSH